jgi:hypothetical protein
VGNLTEKVVIEEIRKEISNYIVLEQQETSKYEEKKEDEKERDERTTSTDQSRQRQIAIDQA